MTADAKQPGRMDPVHLRTVLELWRSSGKRSEIPVVGGSMMPMLRPGWKLLLDHTHGQYNRGDIIVFLQGKLLVAHRVVGQTRSGNYLTKGDALLHLDRRPVSPAQIVGLVVAVRCNGRVIELSGRVRSLSGWSIAVFSRLIAEACRLTRPLRRLTSSTGRLPGSIPGPLRLLRGVNRLTLGVAARILLPVQSSSGSSDDSA